MKTTHTPWYTKAIVGFFVFIATFGSTFAQVAQNPVTLYLSLPTSLQGGSFPIHFGGGGNSFVGTLIISSQTAVNVTVSFDGGNTVLTCKRQIHGYYFNNARGVGLLPLSNLSNASINGVTVQGGIYTACGSGVRLYDLIGSVTYNYNGGDMGTVYFGVNTNKTDNSSDYSYRAGAISWQITNGINGSFFDTMFGIGTISSLAGLGDIGSVGNLIGTFTNIYIQGQAGIGQSVEKSEREILSVNLAGTKTLLTSSNEAISSKIINTANQNTTKNCARYISEGEIYEERNATAKILCIKPNNNTLVIDRSNFRDLSNKDIILAKGANVFLDDTVYNTTDNRNYLSIYIPDGYLIFDSEINSDSVSQIDNNGFKTTNKGTTQGLYLEGNFIVNGLILGSPTPDLQEITTIPFKTYIQGKVAALNTMTAVSEQRERQLINLLSNRSPNYEALRNGDNKWFVDDKWNASMGSLFSWQCDDKNSTDQGQGATPKGEFNEDTVKAVTSMNCAIGHRYPLMIIEKNIPSILFN